jgi:hypothetical protein
VKGKLYLFVICFLFYFLLTGGHLYSPDEEILFRTTKSLARHGSLAIQPLFGFATRTGIDGKQYAQYGIGQPILAIPFYYLGVLFRAVLPDGWVKNVVGDTHQYHDGTARSYDLRFAVSLFNPVVSALLCVVLYSFCLRITRDRTASLLTAVLYGFGSLAVVQSKTFFTEPLAALLVFGALYAAFRGTRDRHLWLVLIAGLLLGYAILTRADSLITLPAFLVFIFLENYQEVLRRDVFEPKGFRLFLRSQFSPKEHLARFAFFAPVLLFMGLILSLNWRHFGSPFATGYEDQAEGVRFSTPLLVGLYGFLFSIGKGLFFFSPPLVLFFFAIKRFVAKERALSITVLVLIGAFLLFQSTWQNWTGGWCWGPRHIFLIHVFLALPIVALLASPRTPIIRIAFSILLVVGIAVQLYGSSQSFIDYYTQFYRTPQSLPNSYALYSPDDAVVLDRYYALYILDERGEPRPTPLWSLIAPLNDSIYVPQNSQWSGYAEMLRRGSNDFFWLHALFK